MKELSVNEKARRYDEAIKIAKDSFTYPDYPGFIRADVVFPELKESEDERIRKALINIFASHKDYEVFFGVSVKDILAWLEKQDKKDEEILILKDQIESLYAAIKAIKETHRIELEKQGEQKNIEGTFINVDEVRENFVKEIYRVLANDTTNDRANDIIYYFDSLPTIYLHTNEPFPSDGGESPCVTCAAWSDEDEQNYNILLKIICGSNKSEKLINNLYDWLKYLKDRVQPQSQWKPSDEQMASITCAVRKMKESACYDSELVSLFNDLKKL